jgi:hypothetical protein
VTPLPTRLINCVPYFWVFMISSESVELLRVAYPESQSVPSKDRSVELLMLHHFLFVIRNLHLDTG